MKRSYPGQFGRYFDPVLPSTSGVGKPLAAISTSIHHQQQYPKPVIPPIKFVKSADGAQLTSTFLNTEKTESTGASQTSSTTTAVPAPVPNPPPIANSTAHNSTENELSVLERIAAESMEEEKKAKTYASPMMILNERFPGASKSAIFESRQVANENGQLRFHFTCRLTISGQEFTGEGWTKKEAKQRMAQRAVDGLPNSIVSAETNSKPPDQQQQQQQKTTKSAKQNDSDEMIIQKVLTSSKLKSKTPMQVLNELSTRLPNLRKPTIEHRQVSIEGAKPHEIRYVCTLTFVDNDNEPRDEGQIDEQRVAKYESDPVNSKKTALQDAAKKALAGHFGIEVHVFDAADSDRVKALVRNKNPCQALNELCARNGLKVEEQSFLLIADKAFRSVVKIGDREIEGESSTSKREARRVTSIRATKEVFGIDFYECSAMSLEPEETAETADFTAAQPHVSPNDVLQRIAAVAGIAIVYENVCVMPQFGEKLTFGQGESTGFGHTRDEAKTNAAVALLHQMGIGEYFWHAAPEQAEAEPEPDVVAVEEGGEEDADGGEEDETAEEAMPYPYFSNVRNDWNWQECAGGYVNYGGGPGEYWQDGAYVGNPTFGYRPIRGGARRGRNTRDGGGPYFSNDLHHHFVRPF